MRKVTTHVVQAEVNVGPGLSSEPAYVKEVKAAIAAAGLNANEVEEWGNRGIFRVPMTEEQEAALNDPEANGYSLEIPKEARDKTVPKPEFASHVWFHLTEEDE